MARSHHRKKHKEHLRQFRHSHDTSATPPRGKTKASSLFSIVGALLGFAVSYFATQGTVIWVVTGLLAGALAGYFIGRKIDSESSK